MNFPWNVQVKPQAVLIFCIKKGKALSQIVASMLKPYRWVRSIAELIFGRQFPQVNNNRNSAQEQSYRSPSVSFRGALITDQLAKYSCSAIACINRFFRPCGTPFKFWRRRLTSPVMFVLRSVQERKPLVRSGRIARAKEPTSYPGMKTFKTRSRVMVYHSGLFTDKLDAQVGFNGAGSPIPPPNEPELGTRSNRPLSPLR
jgi:hypothetical protein